MIAIDATRSEPLVSIIVPVYNAELYLERCIQSICQQSYQRLQIILIDDGSTDSSYQIAQRLSAQDNRIVLETQANAGVSAARNRGLSIATGDYVGFVDSDDTVGPTMYEALLATILSTNADIAECGNVWLSEEGKAVRESPFVQRLVHGVENCCREQLLMENSSSSCCTKLYRRHLIGNLRFMKLTHSEDYLFNVMVHLLCQARVTVPGCYYQVNIGNMDSATRRPAGRTKLDSVKGADMARRILNGKMPQLSYLADTHIMNTVVWAYPAFVKGCTPDKQAIQDELRVYYRDALARMRAAGHAPHRLSRQGMGQTLFQLSPRTYYLVQRLRGK